MLIASQVNIQIKNVVNLVNVVHQELQETTKRTVIMKKVRERKEKIVNHHVLVVERVHSKIKHVHIPASYPQSDIIKMNYVQHNLRNVNVELNVKTRGVKNVRVVMLDHMLIIQVLQNA